MRPVAGLPGSRVLTRAPQLSSGETAGPVCFGGEGCVVAKAHASQATVISLTCVCLGIYAYACGVCI